jgi:magnesium chelatase family protein
LKFKLTLSVGHCGGLNGTVTPIALQGNLEQKKVAPVDSAGRQLLERSAERLHLSARAFHRVIRVARTIADLARVEAVNAEHLAEVLQYRLVERDV